MTYELVHTEEREGFTITLELVPEYYSPDWDFETDDEREQLLYDIAHGNLLWFVAKVSAYKAGVCLADDYLGGCCYESVKSFLTDGYYDDMVASVITEAKQKIKELNI